MSDLLSYLQQTSGIDLESWQEHLIFDMTDRTKPEAWVVTTHETDDGHREYVVKQWLENEGTE